jgi:anaerobic selenocysteine-containing dehydrogenase
VVRCGWGVERNRNGGQAVRAVLALPAVAGKFGVRGGGYTMSLSRSHPIDAERLARPDLARGPVRQINMVQLGRVLTEPQTPPVRALFVYNANPVAMTPDQGRILAGLAREDLFTIEHEQELTDTARFADVLLPATTIFEQRELHKSYGHYTLQYSDAVIEPLGESLSNPALFARLSHAMGFDEPALGDGEDALLAAALAGAGERLGGAGPAELRRARALPLRFGDGDTPIAFVTDTPPGGRVDLDPPALAGVAYVSPQGSDPLVLLSPASSKLINSIFGEFNLARPALDMHPADAAARGLRDGQPVRVFNQLGEVHVPLHLTGELRRGVVVLPKGLWRSSTLNGFTSTALIADSYTDIADGACFNDARVEVAPL